ncbi:phosphatidylserine/phosphatidylglycerophosphate/cardiolipin synthase family protein [Plastorhodobacter daqingensis]|uniref:Phospholipase D n=1 Tax=Plastorhodobacter daqingensis TaxID=1387281 RepID=A0ABW2UJE5_9RHOB
MHWAWWLVLAAIAFTLASMLALWSFGRFARKARGLEAYSLPPGEDTDLDRLALPVVGARPGQTGLGLVVDNRRAFALRLETIRRAGRSLDMLYYIWRDDLTGRLLIHELLAAADRGVRVRILLDDVNTQGFDRGYLALNRHPLVEVRVFNPVLNRRNALRRGAEMILALVRYNRRMHCKSWIADARVALVGGRNIGDTYFGATRARRRNSRDSELVVMGEAVATLQTGFDSYWNSPMALPIAALWLGYEADLGRYRRRLQAGVDAGRARDYLARLPAVPDLTAGLHWSDQVRVLIDPPEKAQGQHRERWITQALRPMFEQATTRVRMVTPYFVPGREDVGFLQGLAARGVQVEVITNALAATNHLVVHGAYRRYRRPLLEKGVRIFEFAPPDDQGRRGEMLHGKEFVVDGKTGFIGSFNYDLRSAFLNTEMGILFEIPELVAELEGEIDRASAPDQAFDLYLQGRWLRWRLHDGSELGHEPDATALRRGLSWVIGHLPIHRFL